MQISSHLTNIVQLIANNNTVSIVAPTGSGKSVGIPAAIASSGASCFVMVPTRTAAISLAEYQRMLQKSANPEADVDALVGYAAEGNINYGDDTRIAYITGGHARRKMLSYFANGRANPIDFADVLMVDEVHSGSLDTTIVISLWMRAAASGVLVPRLVIASATPVPITIIPPPAVYTVEIPAYPIEIKYLDHHIDIDDASGALYSEAAIISSDIHTKTPVDTGHILIFAPGSAEVESITTTLTEILSKTPSDKIATIIPAFGALKQEDIALIYKETEPNERKIVIATNIAEMSITIADVGYVVDTMVEKRAETSPSGGFRLTTHYISKDSAKQRAGRTGRTRPGICYRLCTEEVYDSLEEHRPPEIQRVPIYETVMELLDVGLNPEVVIQDLDKQRVSQAVKLLSRLGMVDGQIVTEMGHFAPKFHISVRNAAFLWNWIQAGYPVFPGIVTAVLIDSYGPSYFWIPRRKPDMSIDEYNTMIAEYKRKHFSKYLGYNDLETSLNMWHDLMNTSGGITTSHRTIIKWSRTNSINNKKIREVLNIIQQCVNAARREGYDVQIAPFTTQGVMTAARPLLLSVYSDTTFIHKRDIVYFSPITREEYRLDNRDSVNGLVENPPKGVIALATAEIKTQRGVFRVIGFAVDTDKDGLGRPITDRGPTLAPRGPRAIVRSRKELTTRPRTQEPMSDITEALDLLQGLALGQGEKEPVSIDREYTRYWYVKAMEDNIVKQLSQRQSYEALNSLERWLVALANISSVPDPIFSREKLRSDHPVSLKFASELASKRIPNAGTIVGTCIAIATKFIELTNFESAPQPSRVEDKIVVGAYSRDLPSGRIDLLLQKGTLKDIAIMSLRYSCLLPRGQQWNLPYGIYELLVNKYGVTIEGFSSPINSQIISVNPELNFCSLFLDTDQVFGSLGSFFNQKLENVKLVLNPPFVEDIMNRMTRFLTASFNTAENLMCLCVVPKWDDAEFYQTLSDHPYLKLIVELAPQTYYYMNTNDDRINAPFASRMFLLSKGFPDINYTELQAEILDVYRH